MVYTGFIDFPDRTAGPLNFWYHADEAKIYWENDKGNTENIWTGIGRDRSKSKFYAFLLYFFSLLTGVMIYVFYCKKPV